MKPLWFAQFCIACSLAALLLNGCGNVEAQQKHFGNQNTPQQPGQCLDPKSETGRSYGCPFDMPPKEWDEPYRTTMDDLIPRPIHMRSCEDTSRFLLMSQDGKWHCLKLTP